MSMPPVSAMPSDIHFWASAAQLRSTLSKLTIRPPASRTSLTVCSAADGLISHPTTVAPSAAKSLAAARPMPLATPVMKAIFPTSLPIYVLHGNCLSTRLVSLSAQIAFSPALDYSEQVALHHVPLNPAVPDAHEPPGA